MIVFLAAGLPGPLIRGSTAEYFVSIISFNPHDSPVSSDLLMTPFIDEDPEAQTGSTTSLRSQWQDYDSNSDLLKSSAFG